MKTTIIILLTFLFLMGSQAICSQSKTSSLPVIDFSKDYPEKKIRLQDIATIEYVPLETTDDILLSGEATLSCVSDKYILVYEHSRGDIYVFNRNGKIHSHFNHKGGSGEEYTWIKAGVILDEKNEEIFVCAESIKVYSLSGEYKRSLKINTMLIEMSVYNFNDEALLIYEDVNIDTGMKHKTKIKPYSLASKKDGRVIFVLDIHLPKRYSTRILQKDKNGERVLFRSYPQSMYYGQDFMIANISSDTLFRLNQNKGLTPILTRKPSVHSSDPVNAWITLLTTDKFILIGLIPLDPNSKDGKIPLWIYEFETGEINKVTFLDAEEERGTWSSGNSPAIEKNMTAKLIQPSTLISTYKLKILKGYAEKLVMTLNEDDNPVVRIIKFK